MIIQLVFSEINRTPPSARVRMTATNMKAEGLVVRTAAIGGPWAARRSSIRLLLAVDQRVVPVAGGAIRTAWWAGDPTAFTWVGPARASRVSIVSRAAPDRTRRRTIGSIEVSAIWQPNIR